MNRSRILTGLSVVVVGCAVALAQQATTKPAAPARQIRPLAGNLHRDMEAMGEAFEKLEKQIGDSSKNASSLELIARMQQLTAGVKHLTPQSVQRLPATERDAKLLEYRKMMVNLLRAELDVEEHLLAGDNEKAKQALEQMDELEHQGHEDFRPKKEERQPRPEGRPG